MASPSEFHGAIDATIGEIELAVYGRTQSEHPSNNKLALQASRTVWRFIAGHLRGEANIPFPVPQDLQGVAYAAATRYLALLEEVHTERITRDGTVEPGTFRVFNGFMLHELVILNRYRVTIA